MEGCDMDFSDIRTIIIGEAGEYGKRLVRYLEIHLSSAVRVYHFTTAEGMQDLIKASLRMRPDRIIVGEVRGAEAMSMLQALSTGHLV